MYLTPKQDVMTFIGKAYNIGDSIEDANKSLLNYSQNKNHNDIRLTTTAFSEETDGRNADDGMRNYYFIITATFIY